MKTVLSFVFAISALLVWSAVDADAGGDRRLGSVAGIVLDTSHNPVPGAIVTIHGTTHDGHRYRDRTESNREGKFGFRAVPAGSYVVAAEHPRVGRDRERIRVEPGRTTHVRLVLH